MKLIADLHVHSRFSIATARNSDLENMYIAARKKGIAVVGTGDAIHPGWRSELKEKLVAAEPGLYRLKREIEKACDRQVPPTCQQGVRFLLTTEISNIYKKDGKTRKNHNLILLPDMAAADRFSDALDRIGNIRSDGRPILGLDARDMLEMLLETSEKAVFIPAHIWTPWFSMLGSRSGFDSVEACFGDLSDHIFAVETGLSSDPPMNWRVSNLDRMTLVSNSDAHSPMKLGREATLFDTELSFDAMRKALKTGDPDLFKGTLEFFPEEGKYHLDGHRKCRVRLTPAETMAAEGQCPACGKPVTVGVSYRVEKLADHPMGRRPAGAHPYHSVIPLMDILSQILTVGVKSKKVQTAYQRCISTLGDEFSILLDLPAETIEKKTGIPLLGEAIHRMRRKKIKLAGGYDGEFGTIRFFGEDEKARLIGQRALFSDAEMVAKPRRKRRLPASPFVATPARPGPPKNKKAAVSLNPAQQAIVRHDDRPLVIVAGPGTGKTMTITHRIAYLIREKKVPPRRILAVTFTNKAAEEMRRRLKKKLPAPEDLPVVATFHAFCLDRLQRQFPDRALTVITEADREALITDAIALISEKIGGSENGRPSDKKNTSEKNGRNRRTPRAAGHRISMIKQRIEPAGNTGSEPGSEPGKETDPWTAAVFAAYQGILKTLDVLDFDDLIVNAVRLMEAGPARRQEALRHFEYLFVDEYQDINAAQYRLMRALASENGRGLCVIGDPDQSIYGFRGSDRGFFQRFSEDFPQAEQVRLTRNYRSVETILKVSAQVIRAGKKEENQSTERIYSGRRGAPQAGVSACATESGEAATIARKIVQLIGGRGYHDVDLNRTGSEVGGYGFEDIAVLFRTRRQGEILADVFRKTGLPCQTVRRRRHSLAVNQVAALLAVLAGRPLFRDIEAVRPLFDAAPGRKTLDDFKKWALARHLAPWPAFRQARIRPVETMTRARQRRLDQMIRHLQTLQGRLEPMDVSEKIAFLVDHFSLTDDDMSAPDGDLDRMITRSGMFSDDTAAFLADLALESDTDAYQEKARAVTLITLHAAKGLEFPVVFIAGCENGLIPFHRKPDEKADLDEERRLFYVGITRAGDKLFFTWAKKRNQYGKQTKREISPFIQAITADLLDERQNTSKKRRHVQLSLFSDT